MRACARVECVTLGEAVELAKEEHARNGHWQRDSIKKALLDCIWSPGLDGSILAGIRDCAHCKNFGGTHTHALLDPITRRHLFELVVGDYLSLPKGFGGYHTVGLYLNTYSHHVRGFKYKVTSSAKTMQDAIEKIFHEFAPTEVFMTDGDPHFNNVVVRDSCAKWGTETHVVSAYLLWVNGLVEGANKILLHILKHLCSPNLGEDDYNAANWKNIPTSWPKHFDKAIHIMNWHLLPSLKFSPKELMLGLVVNTKPTNIDQSVLLVTEQEVATQMAYISQQQLDRYVGAVAHTVKRKSAFNKKVLAHKAGEVIFSKGQLVQIYCSDLDNTFKTERKLLPKWSPPHRITSRVLNSYTLETLIGTPVNGCFSAHRLWRFWPQEGMELARAQKEVEERCCVEEEERAKVELMKIVKEHRAEDGEERHRVTAEVEQQKEVGQQVVEADDNLEAKEDVGWKAKEEEDLVSKVEDEE